MWQWRRVAHLIRPAPRRAREVVERALRAARAPAAGSSRAPGSGAARGANGPASAAAARTAASAPLPPPRSGRDTPRRSPRPSARQARAPARPSRLAEPDRRLTARLEDLVGEPLQLLAVARIQRQRRPARRASCAAPSRRSLRQSAMRGVDGSRGRRYASSTHEIRPEPIRDDSTSVVQPRLHNSWQKCAADAPNRSGADAMTEHLDYDSLRADTVRQVAKLMAAAAITAPKSGGQLLLAGKHLFIETVIVDDRETLSSSLRGCVPAAKSGEKRSGSATPRPPRRSTPSFSSVSPTGTRPSTTAAPSATPPAPNSCTPPTSSDASRKSRVRRTAVQPARHRPRGREGGARNRQQPRRFRRDGGRPSAEVE